MKRFPSYKPITFVKLLHTNSIHKSWPHCHTSLISCYCFLGNATVSHTIVFGIYDIFKYQLQKHQTICYIVLHCLCYLCLCIIYVYVCVCVCYIVCMYVCHAYLVVCMYVCMYVLMYVCTYICMYVAMYVCMCALCSYSYILYIRKILRVYVNIVYYY